MTDRSLGAWLHISAAALVLAALLAGPALAQSEFPFEQEMALEEKPMPGSKRVPMLEFLNDGRVIVDLWCHSGEGRAEVASEVMKLTLGTMHEEDCTPERQQRDEELAKALEQVMQWELDDDVVVLAGPTELRYRVLMH